jgi:hypothetical protein
VCILNNSCLCVSCTGPRSGILFDSFFTTHAGRTHFEVYTKASTGQREDQPLGQHDEDTLFDHYSLKWYGWMLSAMASRTNAGKGQLFIISRLVKFLGLSRAGQEILAKFGFASTLRYSDRMAEETLKEARQKNMYTPTQYLCVCLTDHPHTLALTTYTSITLLVCAALLKLGHIFTVSTTTTIR